MRLSRRHKRAVEKITGRCHSAWHPQALAAYFKFTDRGQKVEVPPEAVKDFNELKNIHKVHAYIVELWKIDFRKGLLSLWDFLNDAEAPDAYIEHAFKVYESAVYGGVPSCYRSHHRTPERFRSNEFKFEANSLAEFLNLRGVKDDLMEVRGC